MNSVTNPKVSVVIPNYNHARFLRRRIESVLSQSFQDFEVILLDDFSTDDSRSILSEYADDPRVRIEFNQKNSGSPFKQWNKGVALANGEYIWIAESDDYADERFLERLVAVLEAEPEAAFAYCRSWRVSADDRLDGFLDVLHLAALDPTRWTADYSADGRDECRNYFMASNFIGNASSVVFRKAIYERVGGADATLRLSADWKLWAAMALTGRVVYLSEPLNYYRFHSETVRGRDTLFEAQAIESLRVVRWIRDQVSISGSALKKSSKYLSLIWLRPVLNKQVPLERRWAILRSAMAIDPRPMRGAVYAIFRLLIAAVRGPIRVYLWHPVMNATRPVRHALGLRQRTVKPAVKD